jgi:energy-coupling factor transporter transmembrane protein EcfT
MIRSYIHRLGQRNPDCIFEKIDPRCKLLVILLFTTAVIMANSTAIIFAFIISGLLAYPARLLKIFIFSTLFAIITWILLIIISSYLLHADVGDKRILFEGIVFRGVPLVIVGFWLAMTTKLNDLTCAMEAWKVPSFITLPLIVASRFITTLFYESKRHSSPCL